MSGFGRRLRTVLTMGSRRQALVVEAAATLVAVRIRLARRPFGDIVARIGRFVPPERTASPRVATPARRQAIARVRWAVEVTAPRMPFRAVCLQRSLAAQAMLTRRGVPSTLHFGGTLRGGAPDGEHVWVTADGIGVAGYPIDPATVEIGRVVPRE